MGSRKVNTEGIDEELLLASIGRRTQDGTLRPAQEVPAAAPTEEDTAAPEPYGKKRRGKVDAGKGRTRTTTSYSCAATR